MKDTPADPNLRTNNSCNYILGGTDPWGDPYPASGLEMPETRNLMSYNGDRSCRNHFSRLQIAVMLRTIKHKKVDAGWWNNNSFIYDSYEPDGNTEMARDINLNQVQEHNFHQQHEYNGLGPTTTQCDVDWVRFAPVCSGSFTIETSAIIGRTDANTRLTLFDNALNQLAQNDDISGSNLYSSITSNFTTGNTYFIRIENMSGGTTGYYQLSIKYAPAITGPNVICSTTDYQILNLPSGGSVTWTTSPTGVVTPNTSTSNPVTFTQVGSGTFTLTAQISACGTNYTVVKPGIIVGGPSATTLMANYSTDGFSGYLQDNNCLKTYEFPGMYSGAITLTDQVATSFQWTFISKYPSTATTTISANDPTNVVVRVKPSGASAVYRLTTSNNCGSYSHDYTFVANGICGVTVESVDPGGETDQQLTLAPNPATSSVTLSLKTDIKEKTIKEVIIQNKAGREVKRIKVNSTAKSQVINIADLPPDVYMIQVYDGEKWISKKIIKE